MSTNHRQRLQYIGLQTILVAAILVVLNAISSGWFRRFDLTEEGRFSVSEVSRAVCDTLPSPVTVNVYFSGEMPARYRPFQEAIETYLIELNIATEGKVEYDFIDPSNDPGVRMEFQKAGWYPFQVSEWISPTEQKDFLLLPFAKVNYKSEQSIVNLVKGCVYTLPGGKPEIDVQKAIANLEYTLLTRIYNLSREKTKVLGFLTGNGEYGPDKLQDLIGSLEAYYSFAKVIVKDGMAISPSIDVLVVAGPDSTFTEREIYEMDQYLMRGGKILFIMDQQRINFDIGEMASTLTSLRQLNLDYMLMKWGVKLNYDIVEDLYCDRIELSAGNPTFGPRMQQRPWVFHPIIEGFPDHPVTKNLDRISIRFGSSMDTVAVDGIEKEVLLQSSNRSRTVQGTQFIDVAQYASEKTPQSLFNKGPFTLGLVLRGKLPSAFATRIQSESEAPVDGFAPEAPTAKFLPANADFDVPKVAIISDGEFATGQLFRGKIGGLPYDNKSFVLNLIDYLAGDNILSQIRSKEVVIRTLDKQRMRGQATFIRVVNMVFPVLLVIAFGLTRNFLRRRRNLSKQVTGEQN